MWPEAIITYAKWGDTLGALSLTLEPCALRRGVPLSARRARGSTPSRVATARRRAGPRRRQARRTAAGTSTHLRCKWCDQAVRGPAVVVAFRPSLRLRVLSRRLSCTT